MRLHVFFRLVVALDLAPMIDNSFVGMKILPIFAIVMTFFSVSACAGYNPFVRPAGFPGSKNVEKTMPEMPVIREEAVTFATNRGVELKLDLAYPKPTGDGKKLIPGLIYVHGGGFVGGKRQSYGRQIQWAAQQGYFAMTVDYRLADGRTRNKFPAAVNDVATAVRWLKVHAADYGVDPGRIGLVGGSAGGNLALMAGLASDVWDQDPRRAWPEVDSSVQAIVNYSGPIDYVAMLQTKNRTSATMSVSKYLPGTTGKKKQSAAIKAGPLMYLDENDPPVLTIHGTDDHVVPVENAILLDRIMKEMGLSHRLVTLPGAGHDAFEDEKYKETVDAETLNFLTQHLQR